MNIDIDKNKELIEMPLCDVPVGWVFKFKRGNQISMLRLGDGCGYCELGTAYHSVEELDSDAIDTNKETVLVFGKLQTLGVV